MVRGGDDDLNASGVVRDRFVRRVLLHRLCIYTGLVMDVSMSLVATSLHFERIRLAANRSIGTQHVVGGWGVVDNGGVHSGSVGGVLVLLFDATHDRTSSAGSKGGEATDRPALGSQYAHWDGVVFD
jgi:hypothetical protein